VAGYVRTTPAESPWPVIALVAAAGLIVSLAVNAVIVWIALHPLRELERTAGRVHDGDLNARAPVAPTADRNLARVIRTFNRMLDQLLAYRQRLRAIAARALDTAEEERKRIARELHDDTAQSLATLLVRLRAARAATDTEQRDELLSRLRDEIAETIERTRRFAQGLRPPALDMLGFVPALEAHARRVGEAAELRIEVDAEPLDHGLSSTAELALYRIVQEALSNVVRHADASEARVAIRRRPGTVTAVVEDDGCGFAVDTVRRAGDERGLGIFGMEERAAYVGGRFEIESVPGRGTRVRVEIPADEEEETSGDG
ncbi:MAG: ATP-binding protein, partial [Gemmatimonadota bacterium]